MKTKILAIVGLALIPLLAAATPAAMTGTATEVDLTLAVKIGDFTTSRYLFEKAYRQFTDSSVRRTGRQPVQEAREKWFRLYLAQQVIKADLVAHSQLTQPEVLEVTQQMARYMLTQPNGLLYRALGGSDRIAFRRERRARILKESKFSADSGNIARLWAAIAPPLSRRTPPREADVKPIGSLIVAEYSFNGAVKQISATDFVRDFQRRIARTAPRDPKDLEEQIEDMVVTEYDLAEARKLGLDRTPQFLEDRRNFALNQALFHYEQEVLSKQVTLAPGELAARYRANIQHYISPVSITGTLFVYSDTESARSGSLQLSHADSIASASLPEKVIDPLVIKRDGPSPLPGVPYVFLASMPIGRKLGPFPYSGKSAVFLKQAAGELAPMPFEEVRPELQRELMREKIEGLELDYLARNAGRVQVYLDLANYGLRAIAPDGSRTPGGQLRFPNGSSAVR